MTLHGCTGLSTPVRRGESMPPARSNPTDRARLESKSVEHSRCRQRLHRAPGWAHETQEGPSLGRGHALAGRSPRRRSRTCRPATSGPWRRVRAERSCAGRACPSPRFFGYDTGIRRKAGTTGIRQIGAVQSRYAWSAVHSLGRAGEASNVPGGASPSFMRYIFAI